MNYKRTGNLFTTEDEEPIALTNRGEGNLRPVTHKGGAKFRYYGDANHNDIMVHLLESDNVNVMVTNEEFERDFK